MSTVQSTWRWARMIVLAAAVLVIAMAAASRAQADALAVPLCQDVAATATNGDQTQITLNCTGAATYSIATLPDHGTVVQTSPASPTVVYTSNTGYDGTDTFTYTATAPDGATTSPPQQVAVVVGPGPDCSAGPSPTYVPVNEDEAASITLKCLDPAGSVSYAIDNQPSNGSLTQSGSDGSVLTYTSASGFTGTDSFTYTAKGTDGTSSGSQTVSLKVTHCDSSPKPLSSHENGSVAITLSCSEPSGDPVSYAIASQPAHGSLTPTSQDGSGLRYLPASGFTGVDSFTYMATAADGSTTPQTVSVSVTGPTCSPTPVAQVDEGASVEIHPQCSDSSGESVTYAPTIGPTHGTVSIGATGLPTYTPDAGYAGGDSFSVVGSTSGGETSPQTIQVNVTAPPTLQVTPLQATPYDSDQVPALSFGCSAGTGTSPSSCTATVDGSPFTSGGQLPNGPGSTHEIHVVAVDSDGQSVTDDITYIVKAVQPASQPQQAPSPQADSQTQTTSQAAPQATTASASSSAAPKFVFIAPPAIDARRPVQGAVYTLGEKVTVVYSCTDAAGPGLQSCTGTVGSGRQLDTSRLGKHTFTVTGADMGGESSSELITYTVVPTTNRFGLSRPRTGRHGALRLALRLPGPGAIRVLATAAGAGAKPHHVVYASRRLVADEPGPLHLVVAPTAAGRRLLRDARQSVALAVTYTPVGGKPRTMHVRGIRP